MRIYRVSSTLNRDAKNWGKQYLLDGSNETCWNSDQGEGQWIQLTFKEHVRPRTIHLTFQGGFAGRDCALVAVTDDEIKAEEFKFWPEDNNQRQSLMLKVIWSPTSSLLCSILPQISMGGSLCMS